MKSSKSIKWFAGIHFSPSLTSLFEPFHEGVLVTDADGVVLYMNEAQARIDDLKAADAVGKKITELHRLAEDASPVMGCLRTGRAIQNRACYYRTDLGRVVNAVQHVYPVLEGSRLTGVICFTADFRNIEDSVEAAGKRDTTRAKVAGSFPGPRRRTDSPKGGVPCTFDDVIGSDPDLRAAVKSARQAAESASPVMICGEAGTGKDLFAQSIHSGGPRQAEPYVAVSCAGMAENLLEAMLFGTSKGAFTGAVDRAGLFEKADGGTLFLDEVNTLAPGLQAKLMRFLQDRKFCRVGSTDEIDVDIKIVTAINLPPHLAIESGSLRPELFYRLAVVLLQIPPLRNRMVDLKPLSSHFLAKANERLGKQVGSVAAEMMGLFYRYHWPGNVRELEAVIEGAVNMVGEEKMLAIHHLAVPLRIENGNQASVPPDVAPEFQHSAFPIAGAPEPMGPSPSSKKNLTKIKKENEIASIVSALTVTQGNAAKAARRLGISPQLMNYKLKRYGIDRLSYR